MLERSLSRRSSFHASGSYCVQADHLDAACKDRKETDSCLEVGTKDAKEREEKEEEEALGGIYIASSILLAE